MTFQDIINEVESSSWQPEFEWVDSIEEVSERINSPHEDYPLGVYPTIQMIGLLKHEGRFDWAGACNIQKFLQTYKLCQIKYAREDLQLFPDSVESETRRKYCALPNQHINLGLRKTNVQVGSWPPPHPMFLQELVEKIFPVQFHPETQKFQIPNFKLGHISPIFWYKLFQTIHPFEDLNGRVGGIILAALTHSNGQFLAPKRF